MIRSPQMTVMVDAVMKAARGLRRDFGEVENLQVSRKGPGDFVSNADHKAEKILQESLAKARPDYGFVMEEGGLVEGKDKAHRWHIDPLDGTINFLHGLPHFCVSLALEREGVMVAGVIYDPIKDELFVAEKGKGAFLNNRRLRVAGRDQVADAVFATGIPTLGRGHHQEYQAMMTKVMAQCSGIRRFGSAALDLAYVAAGRFDGYWEKGLNSWDVAAGIVLVKEAGGFISDLAGRDYTPDTRDLVCGNEAMHKALLALVKPSAS